MISELHKKIIKNNLENGMSMKQIEALAILKEVPQAELRTYLNSSPKRANEPSKYPAISFRVSSAVKKRWNNFMKTKTGKFYPQKQGFYLNEALIQYLDREFPREEDGN
jgi:hypothetical protein